MTHPHLHRCDPAALPRIATDEPAGEGYDQLEELRAGQRDSGEYDKRRAASDEFVESVGADGVFEVVEERSME